MAQKIEQAVGLAAARAEVEVRDEDGPVAPRWRLGSGTIRRDTGKHQSQPVLAVVACMAAKYPNLGDGKMTARNILFDGSPIYCSLSRSKQPGQILLASRARRSPCQHNRSGIEQ
jgi:hypothetical protein